MEIAFTKQRALALKETITWEEVKERAWDKKTTVFGSKLGKIFARPKPDDVKVADQGKRWIPFWHVRCSVVHEYTRTRHYQVPIPQPEVRTVVIDEREYIPSGDPRGFTLVGLEKCRELAAVERTVNALTSEDEDWAHYLEFAAEAIEDLAGWYPAESSVIPAQVRASSVVRQAIAQLIKQVDADTVQQDLITIERIDLYYRPVFAFEFHWTLKDRRTTGEFDGLTGKVLTDDKYAGEAAATALTPEQVFDVGVETIDLLVPGGSVAIKLAKSAPDPSE